MSQKSKKGLGRGLSALFGDQKNEENQPFKQSIKKIPMGTITHTEIRANI